jgi:hypothetical protein
MTTEKITVKTVKGNFINSFSGGSNKTAREFINNQGQKLCYEGKVYRPIGGKKALNALIESGDINDPCFSWE